MAAISAGVRVGLGAAAKRADAISAGVRVLGG
jgi:hypothetical protein